MIVIDLDERVTGLDDRVAGLDERVTNLQQRATEMDDYGLEDLVRLTGYSARAIRHYIQRGLLPRPKLAGRATRYSRETLGRLAAIRVWREEEKVAVPRIKRAVRALSPEEVESWACELDEHEVGVPLQGLVSTPVSEKPTPLVIERWARIPVVEGLDLVMRDGAGEDVRRIAHEIQRKYALE